MCVHKVYSQLQFLFHIAYYWNNEPCALNLTPLTLSTSLAFFKLEIFFIGRPSLKLQKVDNPISKKPRLSAKGRDQGQQQTLFHSTSPPIISGMGTIFKGVKKTPSNTWTCLQNFPCFQTSFPLLQLLLFPELSQYKGQTYQNNLIGTYVFVDAFLSRRGLPTE